FWSRGGWGMDSRVSGRMGSEGYGDPGPRVPKLAGILGTAQPVAESLRHAPDWVATMHLFGGWARSRFTNATHVTTECIRPLGMISRARLLDPAPVPLTWAAYMRTDER